ncbi:MAG TPA: LysR substrate-binding domain-containing protein [Variovorax sp.]|nr:LysR substrate-binding domain-containing protein [Variovorax sp.]
MHSAPPRLRFMRLRHCEILVALNDLGNLRKAAEQLAISQPAVTKALQEIESQMGAALFERHSKGVIATLVGEAVVQHARLAISESHRLQETLDGLQTGHLGRVRVGSIMAPVPQMLTRAIATVKSQHPKMDISVTVDTSDVLMGHLEQGTLDVVIGRLTERVERGSFTFELLGEESLSVVAGYDHPLSKARQTSLKALMGYGWVLQPRGSPMRELLELAFAESGLTSPESIVETSAVLMTTTLVQHTEMLAVVPTSVANHYAGKHLLSILPLRLPRKLDPYGLITRRRESLSAAANAFVKAMLMESDVHRAR